MPSAWKHRMAPQFVRTRLLILCKTYPSPSSGYVETSCIAGMTEAGQLIRLYPVPFRLLDEAAKFRKWQWVEVDIAKATNDHRPESYRLRADTLQPIDDPVSTRNDWADRRFWLDKLPAFQSFEELDLARTRDGVTLGLLKSQQILSLQIKPVREPEWTPEELAKLSQSQGELFTDPDRQSLRMLKKLRHDFYYDYRASIRPAAATHRHKIADWEAGALYWRVLQETPDDWERRFRQKLEQELPSADLMFPMGTIHRFPDQWLIVSLIYPPHEQNLRLL